ncbi:MAG: uridine kinase [Bianqueaceae bacterium]
MEPDPEVEDVGALNDSIAKGTIQELIHVSEALHAKRIANIAEEIKRRSNRIKLVLIAGPSSSGKTTFARKLSIQLRAEGMRPHMISVDNYFVDRDKTPLDQYGKPDFESLEAIDTAQFNEDIVRLMKGETVGIPYYNFKTGKRDDRSNVFSMGPRDTGGGGHSWAE